MLGKEIVINVLAQTKLSHESSLACVLNLSKMPPQYPGLQNIGSHPSLLVELLAYESQSVSRLPLGPLCSLPFALKITK